MSTAENQNTRNIQRFSKSSIAFHWIHTAAFLVLAVTGTIMFLQGTGYSNIYIVKILHRAAAVVFIAVPVVSYFLEPYATLDFIRETFRWSQDDIRWLISAPDFYFGGSDEKMPAQGRLNSGQKLWQITILVTGLVFIVTGVALWGFQFNLAVTVYQWLLFIHAITFIIVFLIFLLHVYLGVFHPHFKESFRSMIDGRISQSYARKHYSKWYQKHPDNISSI